MSGNEILKDIIMRIKLSQSDWEEIGKAAGWLDKEAQVSRYRSKEEIAKARSAWLDELKIRAREYDEAKDKKRREKRRLKTTEPIFYELKKEKEARLAALREKYPELFRKPGSEDEGESKEGLNQ